MLKDNKGKSLIELILVIFILSMLFLIPAIKVNYLSYFRERKDIIELKKDINYARNRAIIESRLYGVELRSDNTYLIIKYDKLPETIKRKEFRSGVKIKKINIKDNKNEIVFNYSGAPKYAGTIYLENSNGEEIQITVTPATGKVNIYYD
ncbi:GspH/FimT family pseudopilin [Tepidimicrobium xylanilyticum]|uniref:General secretion pathway GspH domain-containing protein n=1 Tax=Tepidimicrobium xylanilyticum TaxID=1123352 RepID=A0A1H3CPR0_9FIRM|nr:GspH/FimT family pseudopilin [Tepidimicrobium xylanilyticum]GMG97699.1 hypothetical protein EN5CB1_25250 [Tepidimicrobium xylanilyticum]SDX55888.1 hypothetical protein SAMN05660923_02511 [Tepidimicrobium xylanilyticum]